MTENKEKNLPEFESLNELVSFFDENDFGDLDEKLEEIYFTLTDVTQNGEKDWSAIRPGCNAA